jgi:outer membrane biosynthesis protein TonB
MRRLFGPRIVVEAAFLIAVPVLALVAGLDAYAIVAVSAVAYLLVLVVEATLWREGAPLLQAVRQRRALRRAHRVASQPPVEMPRTVVVRPVAAVIEPEPEPEPEPELEPEPEPEHEPVVPAPPVLVAVPEPEPEPEPEPVVDRTVVPIGVSATPQQWNLWDLERLTRQAASGDAANDEERTFLLLYLREFAGPDGLLPVDFDGLVRASFGDLVAAR